MPVQGFTRLRRHLFARQAAFGTPHAAVRAYPFSGVPDVNRNWTDPDVDAGALITVVAPYPSAPTISAPLTLNSLNYNDLPALFSGMFGGGEAGAGAPAITWGWTPNFLTPDLPDVFTYQFGDDVLTDWFQLFDGVIDSLTIDSPEEGAGVLTASVTWSFMEANSTGSTDHPVVGSVPTGGATGLLVDTDGTPVFLKDCAIFIDSTPGGMGGTQISDALHKFTLNITATTDQKRFANGTQSFGADAVARASYAISVDLVFAKTDDTVGTGSEADAWFSDVAVPRYVKVVFTSTRIITGSTPYSWFFAIPMRYYTRADGAIGGNSTVTLAGNAFYEPDTLDNAFETEVVNTLPTHLLGANPS